MYIRYTQPPGDLFDWYEPYLQDEEEIDPKAGGGQTMTIGNMLKQWLVKLDWFSTLFPRIPVPIQKQIEKRLADYHKEHGLNEQTAAPRFQQQQQQPRREETDGYDDRNKAYAGNSRETDRDRDFRGERSTKGGSSARDYHKFEDRGREDSKYYSKRENSRDRDRSEKHSSTRNYDKYDKSRERDKSYKDEHDRYEEKEYRRDKEYSSGKSSSSSSYTKHRDEKRYRD
jgi:pre-mRNA-splicing factor 38B